VGAYDLTNLHRKRTSGEDCLNGIALEPGGDAAASGGDVVYLTGKKWTAAYRVRLG